jgi:hypothetical protein
MSFRIKKFKKLNYINIYIYKTKDSGRATLFGQIGVVEPPPLWPAFQYIVCSHTCFVISISLRSISLCLAQLFLRTFLVFPSILMFAPQYKTFPKLDLTEVKGE